YDHNLRIQRGVDQADARDVPVARTAGQIGGAVVAPGAMAGGRYIAGAANIGQAGVRGAQVGAMAGAAYGAGSSEGNRVQDAGAGAVSGAVAGGALGAGGRAVGGAIGERLMTSPRAQHVQTLRNHGVSLTPGQMLGGMAKNAEDLAQRVPILGPAIRGARERGAESLNRAVGNRALSHIDQGVPADIPAGGEMVSHVQSRL